MLFLLVVGDRELGIKELGNLHLVLPQGTTAVGDVLVPQDSIANLTGVSATGQLIIHLKPKMTLKVQLL